MIGLISATAAGQRGCEQLAAAWPDRTRLYDGPVREAVTRAFGECEQLVCFLATGAVVRLVAPLLAGKTTDPGVVCVDEAHRHAVALLGGHAGGANALAAAVSQVLGSAPVITTATDAVDAPGLDTLGLPAEGAVAAVARALLDGEPVVLRADAVWPLPRCRRTSLRPMRLPGPARPSCGSPIVWWPTVTAPSCCGRRRSWWASAGAVAWAPTRCWGSYGRRWPKAGWRKPR